MKRVLAASAVCLVWAGLALAPARGEDEILPLSRVKPGMKGHGRTVYRGTDIETFPFEVVDVLRNWYPGMDVILVRCTGPKLAKTKIVQGMSGSPCYIDGKVIGALAYGWSFTLDALAGITPIEQMLRIAERPLEKNVEAGPGPRAPRGAGGARGGLGPCKAPLFVSAVSPKSLAYLEKAMEPYHMVPVQSGGGGGSFADLDTELAPGSALAVVLMRGDMEAYATGTVTWVRGDEVLAFGHSFFGEGEYSLPVANAWTYTVVATAPGSFKLSAPGRVVGSVVQDRQAGVFVRKGRKARLIPFEVHVKNDATGAKHAYRMEIADHKRWTPNLVNFGLLDALAAAEPGPDADAKEIELSFRPRGREPVTVKRFVASGGGFFSNYGLAAPLAAFLQNPYREVHVDWVRVRIDIVHREKRGRIAGVSLPRDEYFPGETVELSVDVERPRLRPRTFELRFRLPDDLEPGVHAVQVRAQDEVLPWSAKAVHDVDTLLHNLRLLSERRSDRIVAVMNAPDYRLQHEGEGMDNLPLSVLSQLLPTYKTGKFFAKGRHYESAPVETGLYITGGKVLRLRIKKKVD